MRTLGMNVVKIVAISERCASSCQEFRQIVRKERDVFAGAVLQDKRNASRSADARNRRRREAEGGPCRQIFELLVQACLDCLVLVSLALALIPGLEADPEEAAITGPDVT